MDARHGSLPSGSSDTSAVRALKDIAFGSVAGMVSEIFEYPFDLAKVRLQSQIFSQTGRFSGPWDCLMQTWRHEGVRGLYRGLPAPIVGAMAETAALFLAYSELQDLIRYSTHLPKSADLTIPQLGLAAGGAGFLTSFILTPIELVKCKMQVQMLAAPMFSSAASASAVPLHSVLTRMSGAAVSLPLPVGLQKASRRQAATSVRRALPGPLQIISNTLRTSGPRGLWLGHTGTIFRETGGTAAWFALKEAMASLLLTQPSHASHPDNKGKRKEDLASWESALSGAVAGGACVMAFYPADTVKSAMQTADELKPRQRTLTFWGTASTMWRAGGWRGLYAGCGMTIARSIPSSAIVFVVYDGLTQRFGA